MTKFNVTRRVPYNADQIFAIAVDVGAYREFLPLVTRSTVRNRKPKPGGGETFDAALTIAYKKLNISETLASRVEIDPANRTVKAHCEEGPVKFLDSEWRIAAAGDNESDIQFSVDYTLKSRSLQFLLSGMFDLMVRRIMKAFEQRAHKLYGVPATTSLAS
ncbi:MAG: type II toxin-antitoxin system RatA family toxin [Hyphomicrobiales bacterium]